MQIRAGLRLDEPVIRALVFKAIEASGLTPEPDGLEADLKNIEHNYFWYDGFFLVAESDGHIVGLIAGRAKEEEAPSKQGYCLELRRLLVIEDEFVQVLNELLAVALGFARRLDYKEIVFPDLYLRRTNEATGSALADFGFAADGQGQLVFAVSGSPLCK